MKIFKPKKGPFVGAHDTPIYHRRIQVYPTQADALMDVTCCDELATGNFGALTFVVCTEEAGEFIALAFNGERYMTPEVVAHEAVHMAWFALDLAGVQVTIDNHEQLAYLVGHYVEQINKVVDAYKAHTAKQKQEEENGKPTP